MNSNEDKFYIKIVASNVIYNLVVEKILKSFRIRKSFRVIKLFKDHKII